jgi:RNA polymerase sigma factor (sigma-70 family)
VSAAKPLQGSDTVFIIDDDASVRDSLSLMLSLHGYVTASFASAEDFLQSGQSHWRGCVIADIRMAGMSGLELQAVLRERHPRLPVIVITAHGDVAAARQAFLANAVDFIEKPFNADHLFAAIEKARQHLRADGSRESASAALASATASLTDRERQVMKLMVQGLHNRQIAKELGISARTVEVHKARVMEKLGVRNLVDFVRLVDGPAAK